MNNWKNHHHQKLNVIQKWAFHFSMTWGPFFLHFGWLLLLRLLSQSSEVECIPEMSISFCDDLGGLFCILVDFHHSDCLANHQKLEHNPKTSISFFDDLKGPFFMCTEMTHPNPKSCSKCYKMPKSNFLFLGATFMVRGYAEMPHPNPNPKTCSKCYIMTKSNFFYLVWHSWLGGVLKCPTLTLKVVPNVAKCLNPTFYYWEWCSWLGYAEMPHPNPKSYFECCKMP